MLRLRQRFPETTPVDIPAAIREGFEHEGILKQLKPGARIAVAAGSRGITNIDRIVKETVQLLKKAGAQPFILPAMGSHGGATPEGQTEVLAEYGISEKTMQAPVRASMDAQSIGQTDEGTDVFISVEALQSDGIVVVNRIKPHTDFIGPIGSGVMKMMVIGLGKRTGAAAFHTAATTFGYERMIRSTVRVILKGAPILCGVGTVENQRHETARLAVFKKDDIVPREEELFAEAKRLMPQLPFQDIHLLVIDRIGKNISGAGMDPNIVGRGAHAHFSPPGQRPGQELSIRRIFVRDLTPETHGNAIGIGFADFTTTRLVQAMDKKSTYINCLTSMTTAGAKVPMYFDSDREVLDHAMASLGLPDARHARVIRIADTLSLERMEVSEAYRDLIGQNPDLQTEGNGDAWRFDSENNLTPL